MAQPQAVTRAAPMRGAVQPRWLAVALIIGFAVALGLLPFFIYIGWPWLALAYLAFGAGFAGWRLHGREVHATESPGPWEWMLAGGNALGTGAAASAVGFAWYGIVYGVAWLADWVVRAAGWDFAIVPAAVATWISVIIVGGMGIVVPSIAVNEVRAKLYPDVAGQRSAYYARAGHRGRILACIAGAVFLGVAALVAPELEPRGLLFTVGTALYFLFITASLMGMPGGKAASRAASGTLGSLVSAFGAAGYRCIERPKTDDPSLDPLIAAVDLLATSDRQAYAVKLEVLSRTDAVPDRDHALEVRIGAKALQKGMASGATPSVPVEPYLLVIGGTVPEDFWGFAGEVGVKLVHVPDAAALAPTGQDAADVALRVLQVPAATPGPRAARASSVGAP